MSRLSEDEIAARLPSVSGWARSGDAIVRTFTLPSFPAAIAFVAHVGFLAEAANHHPDIDIRYNKVTLTLATHDAGNALTAKDFALAERVNTILR
jgi:4a-hydroxytetrahydrobiopterin dehydratase